MTTSTSEYYRKNLAFWETAWSRVKNPYKKLAQLDYLEEIPRAFQGAGSKSILDIACGSGWLCFYLNDFGIDTVGVDISSSAVELANSWLSSGADIDYDASSINPPQNLPKGSSEFHCMDMMDMRFPENSFDGILINAIFEHLDYVRAKEFLNIIKKYIKPKGLMFGVFDKVGTSNKGEYEELEDGSRIYTDTYRDGMLLRYYPDAELKALLQEADWNIVSWRENELGSRIVQALNVK